MVPFKSLGMVSYLPSIVAMAISLAISEIFSIKKGLTLKSGFGVIQRHWKWRRSIDHVWLSNGLTFADVSTCVFNSWIAIHIRQQTEAEPVTPAGVGVAVNDDTWCWHMENFTNTVV